MCEITVTNLGDERLNKKAFLLLGTHDSDIHNDGWGVAGSCGELLKTDLPMYFTSNSGKIIRELAVKVSADPLLGHIRQASPKVPVCWRNSHPFNSTGKKPITFAHNGKLSPKDEKNFIMEEEVDEIDEKTGQIVLDSKGQVKKKKVNISDSILFFNKFLEIYYSALPKTEYNKDEYFLKVFGETMNLFNGKFAMIFIIDRTFYICRGKTAELHISYVHKTKKPDSPVTGWVLNTNKKNLEASLLLLSNLEELEGRPAVHFDFSTLLAENSVYRVDGINLVKIGEVAETAIPVATNTNSGQYWRGNKEWDAGAGNPTKTGSGTLQTNYLSKSDEDNIKEVYGFMSDYSLTTYDIQNLFLMLFGASILEITSDMLDFFCKKVIPQMKNLTKKDVRKGYKNVLGGLPMAKFRYLNKNIQYPWLFNPISVQHSILKELKTKL